MPEMMQTHMLANMRDHLSTLHEIMAASPQTIWMRPRTSRSAAWA
jgi:hypothetical protein